MPSQFTSSHRLILWILTLCISGLMSAVIFFSTLQAIGVALFILALLWALRHLMMPPGAGANRVRMYSLTGIFALCSSHSLWADAVNTAAKALAAEPTLLRAFPWLAEVDWTTQPSIAVLVCATVSVLIVNFYMDRPIGSGHPTPLKRDFPEISFANRLESFCSFLDQHLIKIDRGANWGADFYTELEAEVEIGLPSSKQRQRIRIAKLQTAIRSDRKTKAFLLLGDPGGGKSVALRKLARDMLKEVAWSGRIPIYINLREWLPSKGLRTKQWTEQQPPTMAELEAFILQYVKDQGDAVHEDFVDSYFRSLREHGRLFFILDAFDEIPELLDADEESWLIDQLSDLLCRFCSAPANARGILASRHFRRPTRAFLAEKILDIRPMSEERVFTALSRFRGFTPALQSELLRDRQDLISMARNPLLMSLLGEWINVHHVLPATQASLYDSYVRTRLGDSKVLSRIHKQGLSIDTVIETATGIANFVFDSPALGLEAPVSVLANESGIKQVEEVIDILKYARLARVTEGDAISFAFIHRRFLEYFITRRMSETQSDQLLRHIPSDSRGRDAMVLYAQLCSDTVAERIAQFCWSEMHTGFGNKATQMRAIHSLRFLVDAFLSRRRAIALFAPELKTLILERVTGTYGLVEAKICLEATGLLENEDAVPILQIAMEGANSWLRDTAFRACRALPRISAPLQNLVNVYVIKMPALIFWRSHRSLLLSLSLSDALRETRKLAQWRAFNLSASALALTIGWLIAPGISMIVSMMIMFLLLIDYLTIPLLNNVLPSKNPAQRRSPPKKILPVGMAFIFYQHAFGSFCLLIAGVTIIAAHGERTNLLNAVTIFSYQKELVCAVLLILAMAALDWLMARAILDALLRFLRLPWKDKLRIAWQVFLMTLLALLILLTMTAVVAYTPPSVLKMTSASFGVVVTSLVSWGLLKEVMAYSRDRKVFKHVVINDRMSRQQIAKAFNLVQRNSMRLRVVRELVDRKTQVYGEWPDDFTLSQMNDEAVTELAQLEERWLKLDR